MLAEISEMMVTSELLAEKLEIGKIADTKIVDNRVASQNPRV